MQAAGGYGDACGFARPASEGGLKHHLPDPGQWVSWIFVGSSWTFDHRPCELQPILRIVGPFCRMDTGFHIEIILWALLKSLCRIHVLGAY